MPKGLWTLIKKELARVFTDRRLVITSFILPGLSLAIIYSFMGIAIQNEEDARSEYFATVYAVNLPASVEEYHNAYFSSRFNIVETTNGDLESKKEALRNGALDFIVEYDKDFDMKINDYENVSIPFMNTYYDPTIDNSNNTRNMYVYEFMNMYERHIVGGRLGNEKFTTVFAIDPNNDESILANEKELAGSSFSNLIPLLLSIFIFAGAMGMGMDAVAGEKERGTLSSLLLLPVKRSTIAYGKMISLGILALISTMSSFIGILISMPYAKKFMATGDNVDLSALKFGLTEYFQLITIMILLAAMYVGMIIVLSIIAKSVKEAGTYVSPAYILIMITAFLSMFKGNTITTANLLTPVFGNILSIKKIFQFSLDWKSYGLTVGTSLLTIIVLARLVKVLFENEQVVFKR